MGKQAQIVQASYFLAAIMFVLSMKGLQEKNLRRANWYGVFGMLLGVFMTFFQAGFKWGDLLRLLIVVVPGVVLAFFFYRRSVLMEMPRRVLILQFCHGLAVVLVSYSSFIKKRGAIDVISIGSFETFFGMLFGTISTVSSAIILLKIERRLIPLRSITILNGILRHYVNIALLAVDLILFIVMIATNQIVTLIIAQVATIALGALLALSIGKAEIPIYTSVINALSGCGTAMIGFQLNNFLLIVVGAMIGCAGFLLAGRVAKSMNRKAWRVMIAGGRRGTGQEDAEDADTSVNTSSSPSAQSSSPADGLRQYTKQDVVADILQCKSIIIVPGYQMLLAQSQTLLSQLVRLLQQTGVRCRICVHTASSRIPGHMSLLLAEAGLDNDVIAELDALADADFEQADAVLVVEGDEAVDITESGNVQSPYAGMRVAPVLKCKRVIVIKRQKSSPDLPVYYEPPVRMFFGSCTERLNDIVAGLTRRGSSSSSSAGTYAQQSSYDDDFDARRTSSSSSSRQGGDNDEHATNDADASRQHADNAELHVSVARESADGEKRVALVPGAVRTLVKLGFGVNVETGAGHAAGFTDEMYARSGAVIVGVDQIWNNSEILIKVRPPEINSREIESLSDTKLLVCSMTSEYNSEVLEQLAHNKPNLNVFALDCVVKNSRTQSIDPIHAASGIVGYRALLEALKECENIATPPHQAKVVAGGASAKILVVGTQESCFVAASSAVKLGCEVTLLDLSAGQSRDRATQTGAKYIHEPLEREQRRVLDREYQRADIIILNVLNQRLVPATILYRDQVTKMRAGTVIVDLGAYYGGNCQLTQINQLYVEPVSRVKIIGYTDYESRAARKASELYSQCIVRLMEELIDTPRNPKNTAKDFKINLDDEIIKSICVIKQGQIVPRQIDIDATTNTYAAQYIEKSENTFGFGSGAPSTGAGSAGIGHLPTPRNVALSINLLDKSYTQEDNELEFIDSGIRQTTALYDRLKAKPIVHSAAVFVALVVVALVIGFTESGDFINNFGIFCLAIFLGYAVIGSTHPMVHAPLYTATAAIGGIILAGCMDAMTRLEQDNDEFFTSYSLLAFFGALFASIDITGGFILNNSMLGILEK